MEVRFFQRGLLISFWGSVMVAHDTLDVGGLGSNPSPRANMEVIRLDEEPVLKTGGV